MKSITSPSLFEQIYPFIVGSELNAISYFWSMLTNSSMCLINLINTYIIAYVYIYIKSVPKKKKNHFKTQFLLDIQNF